MGYTVREVAGPREFRQFFQFQNRLYRNCATYVPSLDFDQKRTLSHSPCLDYCKQKLLLCFDGSGQIAGRCCAIINPRYNELYGTRRMRFGWTDFTDDFEAAQALLDSAAEWGRSEGMNEIHGPLGYNSMYKQGLVVEGFDKVPQSNNLYNFDYYPGFLERLGFVKEADWIQYRIPAGGPVPEKIGRIARMQMERYGLRIADIEKIKKRKDLISKFFREYNSSFMAVRNFVPLTEREIEEEGAAYAGTLDNRFSCIVMDGEDDIAAFGICIPSLSEALKKAGGHIFPAGWWHLLHARKHCDTVDMMLVGVSPKWRGKGLSAILHNRLGESFRRNGVKWCISNPQFEDNPALKIWDSYPQKELYIRRRIYIRDI